MIKKEGYVGKKKVEYYEPEMKGEYTYIDGDWTFFVTGSW